VFPQPSELLFDPGDVPDPVGEEGRMPVPWVIQKHADRALLLVTRRCHLHCRYCFRRDLDGSSDPSSLEMDEAVSYLRQSGVHEVILSGGDPLILRTEHLAQIIDSLRPDVPMIRIHSRAPITFPERVDDALVDMLQQRQPVWMVVHINHPDELSEEVCRGLLRLVDAGVPVLNQSVLLRGVNDDPEVLIALSRRLVELRVRPYYLHHPDAVPGGGHFRVSMEEGLAIHEVLRKRLSGIALPQYVIDPPDGTGKVPVAEWVARPVP
jgi:lysine 2,3-aminomutase